MSKHKKALAKAAHETSRFMSAHARAEARAAGWPEHIVRGVHVRYSPDNHKFTTHTHHAFTEDAKNLEYEIGRAHV